MTHELETDAPESRELRLKLPPDTPTGRVRVTVAATGSAGRREFPARPIHPKLAREYDAFQAMLPVLMKNASGEFVAIHDGQVIAAGPSSVAVLTSGGKTIPVHSRWTLS